MAPIHARWFTRTKCPRLDQFGKKTGSILHLRYNPGPFAVISVSHLVKRYGAHVAVDDVSFEVASGEVVGFLGPNGAGKSTTLRILSGFLGKTSGEVRVAGFDVETQADEARNACGYMPEAVPLYPEMRVVEYLRFRAELKRVPRAQRAAFVDLAMDQAKVSDVATQPIGTLSKGYRQRVGLADALVAKPKVLILDEPTAGLDPNQIRDVRKVLRALGKERTVLVSTHILGEVESLCDRVVLIHRGKLLAQGRPEELASARRSPAFRVRLRGDRELVLSLLGAVPGAAEVTLGPPGDDAGIHAAEVRWSGELPDAERAKNLEGLVRACVDANVGCQEIASLPGSLEDAFAALTAGSAGPEASS
jgi:ABC-2 type transport system ATP-binding protein